MGIWDYELDSEEEKTFEWELANGIESSLDVDVFMDMAYRRSDTIRQTRRVGDNWRSPLWEFVRVLKSHPRMNSLSGEEAFNLAGEWVAAQECSGFTADWTALFEDVLCDEDANVEFLRIWDAILVAPGWNPLQAARQLADERPISPEPKRTNGYARFVSMAGWLQVLRQDRHILLPVHKVGAVLGVSHDTAAQYCKWGVKDGYMRKEKESRFFPQSGTGTAAEYRFMTEKFPELSDALLPFYLTKDAPGQMRSNDPRHGVLRDEIKEQWARANAAFPGGQCPWGSDEDQRLRMYLNRHKDLSVERLLVAVQNRFKSDKPHNLLPKDWLLDLGRYLEHPIDRYNKPST